MPTILNHNATESPDDAMVASVHGAPFGLASTGQELQNDNCLALPGPDETRLMTLAVAEIDRSIWSRELDPITISEYVEALENGKDLGHPSVCADRTPDGVAVYRVTDGQHRLAACVALHITSIVCLVTGGDVVAAMLAAASSNQTHGLRRTNEHKRTAGRLALDAQPHWTTHRIARHCGVSTGLVRSVRALLPRGHPAADGVDIAPGQAWHEYKEAPMS